MFNCSCTAANFSYARANLKLSHRTFNYSHPRSKSEESLLGLYLCIYRPILILQVTTRNRISVFGSYILLQTIFLHHCHTRRRDAVAVTIVDCWCIGLFENYHGSMNFLVTYKYQRYISYGGWNAVSALNILIARHWLKTSIYQIPLWSQGEPFGNQ